MSGSDQMRDSLLVSDAAERAALLQQLFEASELSATVRALRASRTALAIVSQTGRYAGRRPPDIVLLDLASGDVFGRKIIEQIAAASARQGIPTILLTSDESEALLADGVFAGYGADSFAATPLYSFVRKMKQHSNDRFVRALRVMAGIGPIRVSLPQSLVDRPDDFPAATV
ncbi:MAG: hypothetical protein KJO82_01985 [Gammaproteobacteria bacterium]|nr:hypothetical protein [Gammaproteobacteria bacterium]